MVTVVVHDGVGKHEHHISLELGCRPDRTALNVLLDLTEIHPPEREKSPTNHWSVCWTSLSVFDWFKNKWIGIFMSAGTCIQIKVHFMTSLCYLWTMVVYPGAISFVTGWRNTLAYLKKTDLQKPTIKHHTKGGVHIQVNYLFTTSNSFYITWMQAFFQ